MVQSSTYHTPAFLFCTQFLDTLVLGPRGRIFKRGWGATFTSKLATLLLAPLCPLDLLFTRSCRRIQIFQFYLQGRRLKIACAIQLHYVTEQYNYTRCRFKQL